MKLYFRLPLSVVSVVLLLFFSFGAIAQGTFDLTGTVKRSGKPLPGVDIRVFKNSGGLNVLQTDASGKYTAKLALNSEYIVSYTIKGSTTKTITINTTVPEASQNKSHPYKLDVELTGVLKDETGNDIWEKSIGAIAFSGSGFGSVEDLDKLKREQAEKDKLKQEGEEKARLAREEEERRKREAEERARLEAEEKARLAMLSEEERLKQDAAERDRLAKEEEERLRLAAEEKRKLEAEALAKAEADKARQELEEKAKAEAERLRREAEEKARLEAETRAKAEGEEKARLEAEARAKAEADEKARLEAEARAK
ncbi:MAG: hypothetical protein H0U27_08520 [Nitrosopumilus sp.]|nr:hypothetical protein [Nitrosopumilus sp.]